MAARPSSTPLPICSPPPTTWIWCLFLDFSNFFSRESMFAEVRQLTPNLAAWMESCYSCQPLLHLGEDTIHSCCGVQQGDPLGPLGFALILQPLLERLQADVSSLHLNVWYLDNDTLMGSSEDLAAALCIVECEGLPWDSTSIAPSPSSTFRKMLIWLGLSFHQTFPPLAEASLFWDVPLVSQTTVRKFFAPGF